MPTATQIAVTQMTMNDARCQALFCSGLQPSEAPTADMTVARARPPLPPSRLAMAGRITGDDRGTLLPDHQHAFVGEH